MTAENQEPFASPAARLYYAVLRGDTDGVEAALNAGASANEEKETHWELAQKYADENNAQLFAACFSPEASGVFRNKIVSPSRPPLFFAVEKNHYETALLLLDEGANPNWASEPLHDEIGDSFALLPLVVRNGDTRLVSAFLRAGAEINHVTQKGMTALRVAVKIGHFSMVRLLLEAGANASFVAPNGVSLLMEAAGQGVAGMDTESILPGEMQGFFSLRRSLQIMHRQSGENTMASLPQTAHAIADAAPEDYEEIVRLLLERGVNVNAVVPEGGEENEIIAGVTALSAAANAGTISLMCLLLDAGADPNAGGDGLTGGPLRGAMGNADARARILLLREHGANINQTGKHGDTPLMAAARAGNAEVIPLLLSWGADLHARRLLSDEYENGYDALLYAARAGRGPCAEKLLVAGATFDARDKKGRDALMLAAQWRHAEAVRVLLAFGADPARRSSDGKTAGDWAQFPTIAARLAGKTQEKWGITPQQVRDTVAQEMQTEAAKSAKSPREEKAVAEALSEPTEMLTHFVQTMQDNTNAQLQREAENQAEILRLLPLPKDTRETAC